MPLRPFIKKRKKRTKLIRIFIVNTYILFTFSNKQHHSFRIQFLRDLTQSKSYLLFINNFSLINFFNRLIIIINNLFIAAIINACMLSKRIQISQRLTDIKSYTYILFLLNT